MKKLLVFVVLLVVCMVFAVGLTRGDAWVGALLLGWLILRAAPGMWGDVRSVFRFGRGLKIGRHGSRYGDIKV